MKQSALVIAIVGFFSLAEHALADEVFLSQASQASVTGSIAAAAPTVAMPVSLSAAQTPAIKQNLSQITQVGRNNNATVAQYGDANLSILSQQGRGNVAVVTQSNRAR